MNLSEPYVLGRSRFAEAVEARRRIAVELRAAGWTLKQTGTLLCRDDTTIAHLLKKEPKKQKGAG